LWWVAGTHESAIFRANRSAAVDRPVLSTIIRINLGTGMGDRFKPILFVDQPDASDAPDGSDGAFSE